MTPQELTATLIHLDYINERLHFIEENLTGKDSHPFILESTTPFKMHMTTITRQLIYIVRGMAHDVRTQKEYLK